MAIYTIDQDNNISIHAGESPVDVGEQFTSEKDFARLATKWPSSRLVAIWNSFAGVAPFSDLKPVKKFEARSLAIERIYKAVSRLDKATAPKPDAKITPASQQASAKPKRARSTTQAAKPEGKVKARAKAAPAPRPGAVFEREYRGKSYSLRAVEEGGELVYRLGNKKFDSLTAAAKDVTGYASISGPAFWGKVTKAKAVGA